MAKGEKPPRAPKPLSKRASELLGELDFTVLESGASDDIASELWQAVEPGALFVGENARLCMALTHTSIDQARAAKLAEHLVRATPEAAHLPILPSWSVYFDALMVRAYDAAPLEFETSAERLPSWARQGLVLVQRRRGAPVAAELARDVALALASTFPRGGPFGSTFRFLADGKETSLTIRDVDDLRRFAAIVDAETAQSAEWSQTLSTSVDQNQWHTIASVAPVLQALPLERLVEHLAVRHAPSDERQLADRSIIGGRAPELAMAEAVALLEVRADLPEALFAAAERLASSGGQAAITTLLAVVATARAASLGAAEPLADRLAQVASLDVVAAHHVLAGRLIQAARAMPADSVRSWAERALPESSGAIILLGAHFDGALFERALVDGPPPSPHAIGRVGEPALAPVLRAIGAATRDEQRQARVRHGLVFLIDELLSTGSTPSEELDLELLIAAFDGRPLERAEYQHTMQAAMERVLRAMSVERRRAILRDAQGTAPMSVAALLPSIDDETELDEHLGWAIRHGYVNSSIFRRLGARAIDPLYKHAALSTQMPWVHDEARFGLPSDVYARVVDAFVPGSKWRAIDADMARALAAMPDVPRVRVYLLEPAGVAFSARDGSRSRLGGPAWGVAKTDIPTDDAGQRQRHLLTLDLADVPELAERHPGAEAIAVFCPGLEGSADDATWVAIARGALRGRAPAGGAPLAVRGFDVPAVVFSSAEDELGPEARAVLDRVRHASGHVFGRPFFIHATGGASDGFLMQLNDALVGGDFPFEALFLFETGEVIAEVG